MIGNFGKKGWRRKQSGSFWGEIAPCDHLVQIYETDSQLMTVLEAYAISGFEKGESVILIATPEHLREVNRRLRNKGYDLFALTLQDQYIPLPAQDTLDQFMINSWPDENLFYHLLTNLLLRARKKDRPVRAFGEMVVLLWNDGQTGATIHLEQLWTRFCESEEFSLLCAYPRAAFIDDPAASISEICKCHTKVITLPEENPDELLVKSA